MVLRFFLELAGLAAAGYWGFTVFDGWPLRVLAGIGVPLVMMTMWAAFRVPGDGGPPLVAIRGRLRLLIETVFFGLAVTLLALAGQGRLALIFGVIVVAHYAVSFERTRDFLTGAR